MKGGVPFRLPAGTAIQIGVKSWNDPSDVLLAYTTATRPEPDGAPYTFSLSLNTSEMLAKFTAGVTRYDCSIEVKWEVSAGSGTFKKTQRRKYSVDADTLRDTDANPSTMLSRNDFLVTNGTGLLVNVAAGYAANGAFVAAQSSLAITNATNYIEVTAAGVASVNTTAFTAGSYPLATVVASAGAITSNTDLRAWITPKPAAAGGVTSITGTANEITVTGTTTPTLSLPSALTFTGKTVTGGTFVLPQVGYLAATFDYFGEWMTFISSTDAATWKRTHATPIVTTEGTIRDPALHYVAATGTFYVAYTRNAFTGGNSWGLGSSTDGRTWTWSTISTGSLATGTPAHVWIGDWFTDSDGTDHVLFAANTTASQAAGGLYLYETHPTTPGDYSAWSTPVQITGSAITNNLGNSPAVVKVGSTYHLFYDLPSAGGIRHVTSTSLTSGFNTAGTYPSFPSATEGPAMFALANGTYRLYAEQNYQQSTAGLKYSDSTDLVTWGSVQSAVTQGYMGHPHGIQVTSQELLNKVSMLEQGQKNPVWSSLYDGKTAVAIGYPDINTESAFGPYGEGLTIFGGASGGSYLYVSTRNQNGAAIFTDPNASSPAGNNFYIARRSGLNYMKFDGGTNNVSFYGTATFLGSTSGSATISVSATGGLLALPSGTTATNMALTTPDLGTPSAIVLTNASGTASININGTVGATTPAAGSFTTLTASSTTSLLLGTAGSAVGTIGFRNATSGTTTLAPATGALGTGTVTLPLSGTLATLEGSNTYTGTTNTFTLPTTTGTTTASGIAVAANSLTTGTGADFSSTSASTTAGQVVRIAKTGAGTLNQALTLTASGGTANVALNATAGHVLVPDGSYVYNTSVSPSIGRSAVAANSINQAGLILESNSVTLLTNSIRGLVFSGYGAFGNTLLITPVGGHTTFSGTLVATAVFQAAENKTSTPNTGTFKGGDGSGTNIAGGILHIVGGASTGSAAGGSILIRTTPAGGSGSSANAAVTAITIDSTQAVTLASTLAVTGASTLTGLLTANGGITLGDAQNIAFNTTTGTKIGATTSQKLGFWNATPIVQPTTAVASATVAHTGGGTNIKTDDTFDGYTLAQVVKALRNAGLLA
jgi:hypothetical protein